MTFAVFRQEKRRPQRAQMETHKFPAYPIHFRRAFWHPCFVNIPRCQIASFDRADNRRLRRVEVHGVLLLHVTPEPKVLSVSHSRELHVGINHEIMVTISASRLTQRLLRKRRGKFNVIACVHFCKAVEFQGNL